jgi:hypothetical protein
VGGEAGVDSYFELVDLWTERLVEAAAAVGKAPAPSSESTPGSGS